MVPDGYHEEWAWYLTIIKPHPTGTRQARGHAQQVRTCRAPSGRGLEPVMYVPSGVCSGTW